MRVAACIPVLYLKVISTLGGGLEVVVEVSSTEGFIESFRYSMYMTVVSKIKQCLSLKCRATQRNIFIIGPVSSQDWF